MSKTITTFVGLDVHIDSIAVGVAPTGRTEPHFVGTVPPQWATLTKTLSRLGKREALHIVYEAGPCGYGWARQVSVTIPDERDEAVRDLTRAREDAVRARLKARQQLKAMLLRHGHRYTGRSSWTAAHERYLASISFQQPAQDIAFAEYRGAVRDAHERVERLTEAMRSQLEHWRMRPIVEALMSLRGIELVAAMTLVAEIGDFTRFARAPELMGFLGLVPSEYSSGNSRRQGAITKTGNGQARRVLVEAAWNYRFPARLSKALQVRQEGQPKAVREIAWRAQLRLARRYRHLAARKLAVNKICIAIARELSAFIWDIARQVKPTA